MVLLVILGCWCNVSPCSADDRQPDSQVQRSDAASVPLFSFGVAADVQYADKAMSGARDYRQSVISLQGAVGDLNTWGLSFVIQLGDIIDGNDTPEKLTPISNWF